MHAEPADFDISFADWVGYYFDNPVDHWWMVRLVDWPGLEPTVLLSYVTRLFRQAGELLAAHSDTQVNQSFWHLIGSGSDVIHVLFDDRLTWPDRRSALEAIYDLFAGCFAPRCSASLSHLDEPSESALNSICYMFWDLFPTWGGQGPPIAGQPTPPIPDELERTLLDVMRRILSLESDACRESALHGLGH